MSESLPVIVQPSLLNFFECIRGHYSPVPAGEIVTSCRHITNKKTKKKCGLRIKKIAKTEYYCALPGCKKTTTNEAPGWNRISIGFARDDGSGGAMQNRHVENVRFCSDDHAAKYLRLKADEVPQW